MPPKGHRLKGFGRSGGIFGNVPVQHDVRSRAPWTQGRFGPARMLAFPVVGLRETGRELLDGRLLVNVEHGKPAQRRGSP